MRVFVPAVVLALAALAAPPAFAQTRAAVQAGAVPAVRERELERINWMEFKETVPSKVQTVGR